MTSLIIEIPVIIGAVEFSRIALLDPLAKVASPYLKTSSKNEPGYTAHVQYLTAAILYYLLAKNFLFLPIYLLQIVIGAIIVCAILCKLTPLWEILMTSFKFTEFDLNVRNANDLITAKQHNELLIENSESKQLLQLDLVSNDNKLSGLKKSIKFNQNVQQNIQPDIIIMNASILVKLTKLLSFTPQPTYRKHRSRNTVPCHRLLICDTQQQVKSIEQIETFLNEFSEKQVSTDIAEVHVASPGDLFLSEKINELDKELVELTEHEIMARKLIEQQKKQNDNQNDGSYGITKKIQEGLICQIKRIDNQKQQYQVQVQENIISKDVTKLSIPAFTIKQENAKKFAIYIIMVQKLDASTGQVKAGWIVPRRYNEFSLLNQHLRKHHSEFIEKIEFPGKTLFNNLGNSFLESRRIQFENYLQGLLIKDEICEDKEFLKFLSKGN